MLTSAIALLLALQARTGLDPVTRNSAVLYLDWSQDSKMVAYTQVELGDPAKFDAANAHAFIYEVDGGKRRQIPGQATNVAFSFDGESLILTSNRNGKNHLFRYNLADEKVVDLTPGDFVSTTPACSPDDDLIAFSSDRDGDGLQIFTMRMDGTHVNKITNGAGKCYNPNFSLDSKLLIFYREVGDNKDQVFMMGVDGSNLRHMSNSEEHSFYPAFTAAGYISYTNVVGKEKRSVIVDGLGKMTSVWPYPAFYMKWAREEAKAAFIAGEFPRSAAYISEVDGSNPIRISN